MKTFFWMERRIKGSGKKSKNLSLAEEWEGGGDIQKGRALGIILSRQ